MCKKTGKVAGAGMRLLQIGSNQEKKGVLEKKDLN